MEALKEVDAGNIYAGMIYLKLSLLYYHFRNPYKCSFKRNSKNLQNVAKLS